MRKANNQNNISTHSESVDHVAFVSNSWILLETVFKYIHQIIIWIYTQCWTFDNVS